MMSIKQFIKKRILTKGINMKLQLITLVFAAITLYSCGPTKTNDTMENNATTNTITSSRWVLETLDGKKVNPFQNGNEIGFTLNAEENRINGYSGCNNFFGTYKLEEGSRIKFSGLGATEMACMDVAVNESEFFKVFNLADNYRITGDRLELNVGKRAALAVFKKAKDTSEPITEKYWKLKTLEGKVVKMDKNQQKEIYFMLKTNDNRVNGFAGCNTISGTYTLEKGNRIHFSQIATTMMACPDLDINESEFLKVFELADNYTINGDVLSLNVGRRAPLAVFEAVYFN